MVLFINTVTDDTTIGCISDNGYYEVHLQVEGNYDFFVRIARQDGTTYWFKSSVDNETFYDDIEYEENMLANISASLRNTCDCENP